MAQRKLKIRDLTLRDGQQSLFATRLSQAEIDKLLPFYENAGFYIMEVWGGAVPDSVMRYLDESPWDRLRIISKAMKGKSLLSALSRGRNLFGYVPYPDYVLEGFYKEAIANGLNVMRIFDALNDIDNVRESIRLINELGGIADGAVCYTVDPKTEPAEKPGFFGRLFGKKAQEPEKIFTDEYFVEKAREMERLGAKIITLKDMAGLVNPLRAASIISKLKAALKVPVDFHTHCTPGYGLASSLMAIINGVDILDTNIWWFGGGSAAPAIELIYVFAQKLGIELEANMEAVGEIRKHLLGARQSLKAFDLNHDKMPREFDPLKDKLPADIDAPLRPRHRCREGSRRRHPPRRLPRYRGILRLPQAQRNRQGRGSSRRHVLQHGGTAQSSRLGGPPRRRHEAHTHGTPRRRPRASGNPHKPDCGLASRECGSRPQERQSRLLQPFQPVHIARKRRIRPYSRACRPRVPRKITGSPVEKPYDVSSYKKPANPTLPEYGDAPLASNREEELLMELLPNVANTFLRKRRAEEYNARKAEEAPVAAAAAEESKAAEEPITGPTLKAPMGGRIISVSVAPGDKVKKGQVLLVYEAMKMENDVTAESEQTVKRVFVRPDDVVGTDAVLIEFE